MDAKTLATQLGLTPKTILSRARALGITGTQTKTEGANGRPATVFSPQEVEQIKAYGRTEKASTDADPEAEVNAAASGSIVLTDKVLAPYVAQMKELDSSLTTVEKAVGHAMAQRAKESPQRTMAYMVEDLTQWQGASVEVNLGFLSRLTAALAPAPVTPNLSAQYLDNLPPIVPRQESLKPAS